MLQVVIVDFFDVISVCLSGVEISGLRGELLDYTLPGF
jgi:hypothetical protein